MRRTDAAREHDTKAKRRMMHFMFTFEKRTVQCLAIVRLLYADGMIGRHDTVIDITITSAS